MEAVRSKAVEQQQQLRTFDQAPSTCTGMKYAGMDKSLPSIHIYVYIYSQLSWELSEPPPPPHIYIYIYNIRRNTQKKYTWAWAHVSHVYFLCVCICIYCIFVMWQTMGAYFAQTFDQSRLIYVDLRQFTSGLPLQLKMILN